MNGRSLESIGKAARLHAGLTLTGTGPVWPNASAAQARRKVVEWVISDADISGPCRIGE